MSAVFHMFDIEARLMTCSLHLELKVEIFKVVPRSCGYGRYGKSIQEIK